MPRDRTGGLPSTVERSPVKAQRTFEKTLDSAEDEYAGDDARARRVYASLKRAFEKVGDHWEPKDHNGPSDAQAEQHGRAARDHPEPTAEGVDANAKEEHLLEVARRLGVRGRSRMNKDELVEAIKRANRRETARARS